MLFMKKLMRNKTAFFIAIALIVNNRAFAMNKNKAQSFQVSAVKKATKNSNTGFVNWVKNHKLISGGVSAAVAVAAAAVGLTVWGISHNKVKDNCTKVESDCTKELEKAALKQEKMEWASIFALCSMDKKARKIFNIIERIFLYKSKDTVKERMINDIKKRCFKITEIIDSTCEKTLKYSNVGLTETEKDENCELRPLTEEVGKKYHRILDSFADILEGKKISKNGEIAEDEVYINIHEFKVINKNGTTVIKDLTHILGLALIKKVEIESDVIEPDDFVITFNNNNQEYIILQRSRNIRFSIYNGTNLITIRSQID